MKGKILIVLISLGLNTLSAQKEINENLIVYGTISAQEKVSISGLNGFIELNTSRSNGWPGLLLSENKVKRYNIRYNARDNNFYFYDYTRNKEVFRIQDGGDMSLMHFGGNVGIGTTNPNTKLDVNGIISSRNEIRSISSNPALLLNESDVTDKNWHLQVNGGDLKFYEVNDARNNWDKRMIIKSGSGNVAIYGKLESTEIKVTTSPTADFVFEEDYNLPTLKSIEKHIKEKKHLPEIASAKEMEKNGVNVGNFQIQLLQKIEELTLYTIEQEKKIKALEKQQKEVEEQKSKIKRLESLIQKLLKDKN